MYKKVSLLIILLAGLFCACAQTNLTGIVFNDQNRNNHFDLGEEALPNISVSSLSTIVQSNRQGIFQIPVEQQDIVFVIKPNDFEFPLQANRVPSFYHIVYQKPSPEELVYEGIQATQHISDTLYFPMYKSMIKNQYSAQLIGDIQAPTKKEVEFFQETIVPLLYQHPADFKICLGDIADNDLSVYPLIEGALWGINTPLYMVLGNHDINYRAKDITTEAETFRKHFGPDYYSFNYGTTHFVVLNTVQYAGWDSTENKHGSYHGGLQTKQLNWLKQDLTLVEKDQQIVLLAHIPLLIEHSDSSSIQQVFDLLKNQEKILAIYGHLHLAGSWQHTPLFRWNSKGKFDGQIAGAACGAWWVGPYGLDSIPDATCVDGCPPGIYLYNFYGQDYSKEFIAASNSRYKHLRISFPPSSLPIDSIKNNFIYVNVFDGNDNTQVQISIDDAAFHDMKKVIEIDPYLKRNNYLRFNREKWKPGLVPSSHLWKVEFPTGLLPGKHVIKASCQLQNGKKYITTKVFEISPLPELEPDTNSTAK
ncbi:MAG: calcineurin-like phosphoesterase C-terminal domain-containing protein [Prolixibacteraceae bacterium]